MQGLVYIFIALAALGVGAAAYFGLTFSPIEAMVTAIAFGCVAVVLQERALRPLVVCVAKLPSAGPAPRSRDSPCLQ